MNFNEISIFDTAKELVFKDFVVCQAIQLYSNLVSYMIFWEIKELFSCLQYNSCFVGYSEGI